jgi:hypothetical protein
VGAGPTENIQEERIIMMYYYELKNTKTGHCFTATAKSTKDACAQHDYKAHHCKVIYKASV